MTKETRNGSNGLESLLAADEGLEGRLQLAYAKRQDRWRQYEGILDRLREQSQSLGSQLAEIGRRLAIVKAGISQAEFEQTSDELAWFEELVQARKQAILAEANGSTKSFPGKNA